MTYICVMDYNSSDIYEIIENTEYIDGIYDIENYICDTFGFKASEISFMVTERRIENIKTLEK